MKTLTPREARLLLAALALLLLAVLAPPLAQPGYYHHFADQRSWRGIPHPLDVLSNLPFALLGAAGLVLLRRVPAQRLARATRALTALSFAGLLCTAACSAWYHWRPDDAGLAVDRLGMTVAFAGLLGLATADRLSARAGVGVALAVLLLGPLSVWVCAVSGNVLPWALLQGGGMVLLLALAFLPPVPGALAIRWGSVIGLYALAKAFELGDHLVYDASAQLVSGHSLKHVLAALAAWPILGAVRALGQNARQS